MFIGLRVRFSLTVRFCNKDGAPQVRISYQVTILVHLYRSMRRFQRHWPITAQAVIIVVLMLVYDHGGWLLGEEERIAHRSSFAWSNEAISCSSARCAPRSAREMPVPADGSVGRARPFIKLALWRCVTPKTTANLFRHSRKRLGSLPPNFFNALMVLARLLL